MTRRTIDDVGQAFRPAVPRAAAEALRHVIPTRRHSRARGDVRRVAADRQPAGSCADAWPHVPRLGGACRRLADTTLPQPLALQLELPGEGLDRVVGRHRGRHGLRRVDGRQPARRSTSPRARRAGSTRPPAPCRNRRRASATASSTSATSTASCTPSTRPRARRAGRSRPTARSSRRRTASAGRVFVGSYDQYLYALIAATGALVWKFETGGPGARHAGGRRRHGLRLRLRRTAARVSTRPRARSGSPCRSAPTPGRRPPCATATRTSGRSRNEVLGDRSGAARRPLDLPAPDAQLPVLRVGGGDGRPGRSWAGATSSCTASTGRPARRSGRSRRRPVSSRRRSCVGNRVFVGSNDGMLVRAGSRRRARRPGSSSAGAPLSASPAAAAGRARHRLAGRRAVPVRLVTRNRDRLISTDHG